MIINRSVLSHLSPISISTGVGAAAVCGQTVKMASLPMETSIFSSEAHAINIALDILSEKAEKNFVIFSDSLSVVKSLHVHCFQP